MCGIAGIYHYGDATPVNPQLLRRMCDVIAHRGPDDQGYYVKGPIGLGHRRLSIIDLSSGHQPISNEDNTVWVVFNGEIYNYQELRDGLISSGHQFRTSTDTEVIVHLYEEKGEDFVLSLRGMFAIALWDERRRKLLLARDRVGKKPLFYTVLPGGSLIFGSEIKAIVQNPAVKRKMNVEALDAYLSLLYVPGPATMFDGIYKLQPGHVLSCTPGKVALREYWDLLYQTEGKPQDENAYIDHFRDLLSNAVKIRLRSDVPLGAFLSGGVDSTTVVAFMAELLEQPVVTCCVGFQEEAHNELPAARQMAAHFRTEHYEHVIEPNIPDLVPRLIQFFDEPFGDSSAIPTYYVSQMARQHVTVALSGDGGDEVFAGYSRHYLHRLERRLRRALGWMGASLVSTVGVSLPAVKGRNILRRLGMPADIACAWMHCDHLFNNELKAQLYSDDLRANCEEFDVSAGFRSYYNRCSATDPLDKALYVDIKTYLADDILVKVDRMSMAHGLEVRAPLLDHKLLEFTATLPTSLKLKGRTTKVLLKRTMAGRVPQQVLTRTKHGFTMPVADWLRKSLRELVEDCLFAPRTLQRGFFNPAFLKHLWAEHLNGRHDFSHHLWLLLMFELWHREYLDHHV